jgi:hypothetical protein
MEEVFSFALQMFAYFHACLRHWRGMSLILEECGLAAQLLIE